MTSEEAIEILRYQRFVVDFQTEKALEMAISALRQQERFVEVNKALTPDELSERNAPVFLPIKDFPNGGYWCLCENGYVIPPSGHGFMAKESVVLEV